MLKHGTLSNISKLQNQRYAMLTWISLIVCRILRMPNILCTNTNLNNVTGSTLGLPLSSQYNPLTSSYMKSKLIASSNFLTKWSWGTNWSMHANCTRPFSLVTLFNMFYFNMPICKIALAGDFVFRLST